jgi:predicted dehydrogenase
MNAKSTHRCLMIGAGGMANAWIRNFFPRYSDRMEVVGLVDVSPEPLQAQGDFLGLPAAQRFGDMPSAFATVDADFCVICVPPAFHEEAVMLAVGRGMPILSEKPIADTWEACVRICRAVQGVGLKMMVTQNYRYTPRILTFKDVVQSGRAGRLNYLVARFADDYRQYAAWGVFRHEIPHALLVEGAIHHFDQIRNITGADCETIFGWEWNPQWSSFKGASSGLFVVRMADGTPAHYEGNCSEVGHQTSWHHEYYRAECEGGAVVLDSDDRVWIEEFTRGRGMKLTEVPHIRPDHEGHQAIVWQFLNWLDGGDAPATILSDNIKSAAMLFGAIEASETGQPVSVAARAAHAV